MIDNPDPQDILSFWRNAGPDRWFAQDRDFDGQIRWTFFGAHQSAAYGNLDHWLETADGALALIILLDQFPRNIFRGLARAFATDDKARHVARHAIENAFDGQFTPPLKRFFYLPFMHAEQLDEQEFCLAKCAEAADEEGVRFSIVHRDIIARFGRFPHRNQVLRRVTTADEQAFLDAGGFAG